MNESLLLMGIVILICILLNQFLEKIPIPSLLIFIIIGMCFGENGVFRIVFNDYAAVNVICSICLIFIMFYGGIGTNIWTARPVLSQSVIMSTLGVVGTAFLLAIFTHFVLNLPWLECFLIGSVISSTDAASVFNILRSQNLALRYHTDSLLEIESGSNDPMSFMLTTIAIALMSGQTISVPLLLAKQIIFGIFFGVIMGMLAVKLLHRQLLPSQESHTIFLFAIMVLSYTIPSIIGGNGYLSVYLSGIWIGNSNLPKKKYLIHFFDVLTHVSQVQIFFLLGLLVTPIELPSVIIPALILMIFLTFIARPLISTVLLIPFQSKWRQIAVVSWSGLRGAASIVFAISAVLGGVDTTYNLYNLIFCMVLISISVQGTLLPIVAQKLDMIDPIADIGCTFTDYQEDSDVSFIKLHISLENAWCNKKLSDLHFPPELLVAMIVRKQNIVVPTGNTILENGDLLVLAARKFEDRAHLALREVVVERGKQYANRSLSEISIPQSNRVILIKRGIDTIIPDGNTVVKVGDILVLTHFINQKFDKKSRKQRKQ